MVDCSICEIGQNNNFAICGFFSVFMCMHIKSNKLLIQHTIVSYGLEDMTSKIACRTKV